LKDGRSVADDAVYMDLDDADEDYYVTIDDCTSDAEMGPGDGD
jgi:hypothetical protein